MVAGDININVDTFKNDYSKDFTESLSNYNLLGSINSPTHFKGHSLDLALTRSPDTLNPTSIPLEFPYKNYAGYF